MGNIPGIRRGPSVGPVDGGAQIVRPAEDNTGSALAQLGGVVRQVGNDLGESFQKTKAQSAIAGAQKRLQDFAFTLKNGSVDPETGQLKAPPDPDKHDELFNQEAQRIKDAAGNDLSGTALRMFDSEFEPFSQRQGLQVRADALDIYKGQIGTVSDETLAQLARNHVNEGEIGKGVIRSTAEKLIQSRVAEGVWTPAQGYARQKQFDNDSLKGSFLKIVNSGMAGPGDAIKAIRNGEFNHLPADDLARMEVQAMTKQMHNVDLSVKLEDRAWTRRQRNKQIADEESFREGLDLLNKDKLSDEWLAKNRNRLSNEHYKLFGDANAGRGSMGDPDVEVLTDLKRRAYLGEDVIADATALAASDTRMIRVQDLNDIIKISSEKGGSLDQQNWMKNGTAEIDAAFKTAREKDPVVNIITGDAMREWHQYGVEHPDATPTERAEKLREIKANYLSRDLTNTIRAQRAPKLLKGGKAAMKSSDPEGSWALIQQAKFDTDDAHARGEMSDDEYRFEMDNFAKVGRAFDAAIQKKKAREVAK